MDFIDNLSSKSRLVFKIHNSMSNAKLWSYLYNQCMESNIEIDEGMSFSKLKHKISNVMLMVKTFNMLICSSDGDMEDITKSEIFKEEKCCSVNSEILAEEIKKQNVRLTKIESTLQQNQVTQVAVITKRQRQSQIMPDINDPELDHQTAKLKLKIDKHLLKISKTFPKFDKCRTLIENSHTFEANCSKFDLSEEQKNILFKRWLPVSLANKLQFFSSPEGQECNEFDRVKQLFLIATGEIPSSELISRFKVCNVQDDVYTFAAMFEKAYRLVMELNDIDQPTPQSMINEFVKKCTFLHPVSNICASSSNSFQEAVAYVEKYRLEFLSQSSESPDTHIVIPIGTDLKVKVNSYKYSICNFCQRAGHVITKCFRLRKKLRQNKIIKNNFMTQEVVQIPKDSKVFDFGAQNSNCCHSKMTSARRSWRGQDRRSYSLLLKRLMEIKSKG